MLLALLPPGRRALREREEPVHGEGSNFRDLLPVLPAIDRGSLHFESRGERLLGEAKAEPDGPELAPGQDLGRLSVSPAHRKAPLPASPSLAIPEPCDTRETVRSGRLPGRGSGYGRLMRYHLFVISGWPVIRNDRDLHTHKRHLYVGAFEDVEEMVTVFDRIYVEARRRARELTDR